MTSNKRLYCFYSSIYDKQEALFEEVLFVSLVEMWADLLSKGGVHG